MNYEELVKALRFCFSPSGHGCECCPYKDHKKPCDAGLLAAAAIEELQAEAEKWRTRYENADDYVAELKDTMPHWVSVEDELPSEFQYVWAACKMNGRENWTIETVYDPYLSCPWGYDIPELRSGKDVVYAWMDRSAPKPPQEVQDGKE